MAVGGNLTVSGTTTTVNSNEVNIGDNIIVLNSDETGTPSQNGGIEVERGTSTNVSLLWNETNDYWTFGSNHLNFPDNSKAYFGTGNDLEIYHDGTHSYIDSSTGSLYIRTGNTLQFKNQSGSETLATFAVNGASTLYYDNAAKLATTSSGIDVTGDITLTGNVFTDEGFYGNRVWNEDNSSLRFATNNTEVARFDSSGNLGIGTC